MVHLIEDFYLDFDSRNYILMKKTIVSKVGSANIGNEVYIPIAFSSHLKGFIVSLAEHLVKQKGSDDVLSTLKEMDSVFRMSCKAVNDKHGDITDELYRKLSEI